MIRYVTVNEITGKVVNVGQVPFISSLDQPAEAQRHIVESDWVEGSDPAIDDEWDGQSPTTFTKPATELNSLSIGELLDRLAVQQAEQAATQDALRALLGN